MDTRAQPICFSENEYQEFRDKLKRGLISRSWLPNNKLRNKFIGEGLYSQISDKELLENFSLVTKYPFFFTLVDYMLSNSTRCLQLLRSSSDEYFKERLTELTAYITSNCEDQKGVFLKFLDQCINGSINKFELIRQFTKTLENAPLEGRKSSQTETALRKEKCDFLQEWINSTDKVTLKIPKTIPQPRVRNQAGYSDFPSNWENFPSPQSCSISTSPEVMFSSLNQAVVRNSDRITPSTQQFKRSSPHTNQNPISPSPIKRPRIDNYPYCENPQNFQGNLAAQNNTAPSSSTGLFSYTQGSRVSPQFFPLNKTITSSPLRHENMPVLPVPEVNQVMSQLRSAAAFSQHLQMFQSRTMNILQIPSVGTKPVNNSPEPVMETLDELNEFMELDNFNWENVDFDSTNPDIPFGFHAMQR